MFKPSIPLWIHWLRTVALSRRAARILLGLTLLGWAIGPGTNAVRAEGSLELTGSGGYRPYLEFRNDTNGGILRRTVVKVYAQQGERINLASSAMGLGSGRINYRRPNGTTGSCVISSTVGRIANRAEEVAKSYLPCIVIVGAGESGVWEIDFVSPNQTVTGSPPAILATGNWAQPNNVSYVSAWDVTVRSSSGTAINGRVYANYFAFNMGANGIGLSSEFRLLTQEGYRYFIDLNDLDPFGFIFFANRNGFRDSALNPLFRSLQFVGPNPGQLPTGYSVRDPNSLDDATGVTHKLFINTPDPTMPSSALSPQGTTWLYNTPLPPPVPQNFTFRGVEGTQGQAGTQPLGGNFTFDSVSDNSYRIVLDLNLNGTYGDSIDRIFTGRAKAGSNTVFWDGLDGNGNPVPAATGSYGAQINLYAGEAHFPLIDAENNPNGLIIRRDNNPAGATTPIPDPFTVYYDDRNTGKSGQDYSLCAAGETGADCYGIPPNPRAALSGLSSASGAHAFGSLGNSNGFGDRRGIDTWVYYPSQVVQLAGGIVVKEADLVVTKTDNQTTTNPGSQSTYIITVQNKGPSNVTGAEFTDNIPTVLTNVSWTCSITTGTGACDKASGTGNNITAALNLNAGAIATFTVIATVSPTATGTITNTAQITRTNDVTDPKPSDNTATDTTDIVAATAKVSGFVYEDFGSGTAANDNNGTLNSGEKLLGNITVRLFRDNNNDGVPDGAAIQTVSSDPTTGAYTFTAVGKGRYLIQVDVSDPDLPPNRALGTPNLIPVNVTGSDINDRNFGFRKTAEDVPELSLVKRLTAINGNTLNVFVDNTFDDPTTPNNEATADNQPNWPPDSNSDGLSDFLSGALSRNNIRPGDELEYTIYFLSSGNFPMTNVNICDMVPINTTYVPSSISLFTNNSTLSLTDPTDSDAGIFYAAGNQPTVPCPAPTNVNGAVVVNLAKSPGQLPFATAPGSPAAAYGYIRFRVTVN